MRRKRARTVHNAQCQASILASGGRNFPAFSGFFGSLLAVGGLFLASAAASGVEIVPHRAAYAFEVVEIDSRSGVSDISGGMTFEWADTCDGWATDQRYLLRIISDEGGDMVSQSSSVNWESKDGRHLRFHSKRERNGEVVEQFSGEAELDKAALEKLVAGKW